MARIIPIQDLNALAWTLFTLATLLTFGRFSIRWMKTKRFYLNDIFNGVALIALLIFVISYQVYLPIQYNYQLFGLGLGGYIPTDAQIKLVNSVSEVNVVFFWLTIYAVKASFLDLYWSIFAVSKGFRYAWFAVTIWTTISFLVTFFVIFWSCGKPTDFSNITACNSISNQLVFNIETIWCALNVSGDIMIMLLPVGMLWKMNISTGQKWGLAAIAGLVLIDVMFDILRTIYTIGDYATSFPNANAVWDVCEPAIAVIVCTLPPYRTLLRRQKVREIYYELGARLRSTRKTDTRGGTGTGFHEMENISTHDSTKSVLGDPTGVHVGL